jgi:3-oxoacyl-(acyl-carrier-protein) synthase
MSTQHRDAKGRPIVAVTGLGIVTSLGQGKQTNWDALTAGKSGIHRIERFPTEGLRTTMGGTVDFLFDDAFTRSRRGRSPERSRPARRFSRRTLHGGAARRDGMAPEAGTGAIHRGPCRL